MTNDYRPGGSSDETRPMFCHNHEVPCRQPCSACEEECDPKYVGPIDYMPGGSSS